MCLSSKRTTSPSSMTLENGWLLSVPSNTPFETTFVTSTHILSVGAEESVQRKAHLTKSSARTASRSTFVGISKVLGKRLLLASASSKKYFMFFLLLATTSVAKSHSTLEPIYESFPLLW